MRSIEDLRLHRDHRRAGEDAHPRLYAGSWPPRRARAPAAWPPRRGRAVDLIAVNLYPFERTVAGDDVDRGDVIEKIDIGGPSMIRAAAKNHAYVAVS